MAGIPDGCDAVLIMNIETTVSTEELDLARLQVITEESYGKIQTDAGVGFSIKGIPFSGSYADFDEQRRSYLNQQGYTEERNIALSTLRSYVREDQVKAWQQCKEIYGASIFGFRCWCVWSDENVVCVAFSWNPEPTAHQEGVVQSQLIGAKSLENNVPSRQAFPTGFKFTRGVTQRLFRRELNQVFHLVVNVNGMSDEVQIPTTLPLRHIVIPAIGYKSAVNIEVSGDYGDDVIQGGQNVSSQPNRVDYDVQLTRPGRFQLSAEYASGQTRPVSILLNNQIIKSRALYEQTNSWNSANTIRYYQCDVSIPEGGNVLSLETKGAFPHIKTIFLDEV